MKKFTVIAVLFVVLVSMGCKSKPPTYADDPRSKIVGAEGVPRPEWMNGGQRFNGAEEGLYYVIGIALAGGTKNAQESSSRNDAAAKLAQWKNAVVMDTMKSYQEEGGTIGNTQTLYRFEQATITRSQANVSGFEPVEYWYDQNGVYHRLFSYPKADLRKDFSDSVNQFQRNEAAAFADFKAQEAFRQLEAQLNK